MTDITNEENKTEKSSLSLLTIEDLVSIIKVSKPTMYKITMQSDFPTPIDFGERSQRWVESEILDWIYSKRKVL